MVHKTSRKSRPTPLKDVQIAVQADESRRYLILDTHSSLSSPAYPIEQQAVPSTPLSISLHENHSAWQVRVPASNDSPTCTPPCVVPHLLDSVSFTPPLVQVDPSVTLSSSAPNYRWDDSVDSQDVNHLDPVPLHSLHSYRSFTPPISPPILSPSATDAEYSSKRSGMTFALVPAEVDGKHVFTHVVVDHRGNDFKGNSGSRSITSEEDGLPEDMQDILRQLDDLASWVKAASSSRDCVSNIKSIVHGTRLTGAPGKDTGEDSTGHPGSEPFPNKGKNRLLSTTPLNSECSTRRDLVVCATFHRLSGALKPSNTQESSRGTMSGKPTNMFLGTSCQSEEFIYVANCNTPEFLVGSSNSPIAYPVCGYSSHPSRSSPHPLGPTHGIPYHRRFLERRSAPCPPPTPPLVSPPLGKTSFKMLFQRSRCNTTAMSRTSIPSGHVPVEGALRQGKRMRLPWLKI